MKRMSPLIEIRSRRIGQGYPVYVIAEMSANHGQSLAQAVKILEAAKQSGADAVKLQTYTPDTLTIDSVVSMIYTERLPRPGNGSQSLKRSQMVSGSTFFRHRLTILPLTFSRGWKCRRTRSRRLRWSTCRLSGTSVVPEKPPLCLQAWPPSPKSMRRCVLSKKQEASNWRC